MSNENEVDVNPDDPDDLFLPSDRRKFYHTNPWDVLEHNRALAAFEERQQAHLRANLNTSKKTWYGFREHHVLGCTCSYCGYNGYDRGLKQGWNIPPDAFSFNSWYVHRSRGVNSGSLYLRCTPFFFLRKPQLAWLRLKQRLNDLFKWTCK